MEGGGPHRQYYNDSKAMLTMCMAAIIPETKCCAQVACLALGTLSALRGELRLLQVDSPRAEGLAAIVSSEGGSAIVQAAAGSVKALVQHAGEGSLALPDTALGCTH